MSGIDSDVDLLRLLDLASLTKGFSGAEIANSTGFGIGRQTFRANASIGCFLYCVVGHGAEYCLCVIPCQIVVLNTDPLSSEFARSLSHLHRNTCVYHKATDITYSHMQHYGIKQ